MSDLLIADDEKWIRKGIIAKLKKSGLHFDDIYEAGDGLEAKNLIEEKRPRIAITDYDLVSILQKVLQEVLPSEAGQQQTSGRDIISGAREYIAGNYGRDITVKDIAAHVSVHPNYLSGIFRKATGETLTQYLTGIRIEAACYLLRKSDEPICNISCRVGYHDNQYFYRVFKKLKGETPADFRNQYRNG